MSARDEAGPFFHGTRAALQPGDLLRAGFASNYRPEVTMRHVYFRALPDGGGLPAQLSVMLAGDQGAPHVYEVEPTGPFEDDPNVTDKRFPGNPTRSYRTTEPLRIVHEVHDWTPLSVEDAALWRARLRHLRSDPSAEIVN